MGSLTWYKRWQVRKRLAINLECFNSMLCRQTILIQWLTWKTPQYGEFDKAGKRGTLNRDRCQSHHRKIISNAHKRSQTLLIFRLRQFWDELNDKLSLSLTCIEYLVLAGQMKTVPLLRGIQRLFQGLV